MSSGNHLNDEFFKKLGSFIPGLKKQKEKLAAKAIVSNIERKAHQKIPCAICGKSFDGFNGFAQKKKAYCEACQSNLDAGFTCLVTMDAKRYAFVKFPQATADLQMAAAGKIFTVSTERMDEVEKSLKPKPENN